MSVWQILAACAGLILLLLLCPLSAQVTYEGQTFSLTLHYLFVRINPLAEKTGKKKEKERLRKEKRAQVRREKSEKKKEKKPKPESKRTTQETVGLIFGLVRSSRAGVRWLRGGVRLGRVKIMAAVGGDDARETAERFYKLSASVYAGLGLLGQVVTVAQPAVFLRPDFTLRQDYWDVAVRVRVLPFAVLAAVLHVLTRFLFRELIPGQFARQTHNKGKGGIHHEPEPKPAASAQ